MSEANAVVYPALLGLALLFGLGLSLPLVAILSAFFHVSHSRECLREWQALSSSSGRTDEFFQSAEYLAFLEELRSSQPTFLGTLSGSLGFLFDSFCLTLRLKWLLKLRRRVSRRLFRQCQRWRLKFVGFRSWFSSPNVERTHL